VRLPPKGGCGQELVPASPRERLRFAKLRANKNSPPQKSAGRSRLAGLYMRAAFPRRWRHAAGSVNSSLSFSEKLDLARWARAGPADEAEKTACRGRCWRGSPKFTSLKILKNSARN